MSKPLYQNWGKSDYEKAGIKWLSPMLAKEITDEEEQDKCLNSADYFIEEKFDGTRALLHFFEQGCRVFSRRVSEKTGWFCENSDSLPHLRDISGTPLSGTIIDGEMFIPNRPFKDVSSTLNCTWDKAIERQKELGNIVFHAFDILFYRGIDLRNFPLKLRKVFLHQVVKLADSPYIEEVKYFSCDNNVRITINRDKWESINKVINTYSDTYKALAESFSVTEQVDGDTFIAEMSPRGYYEFIVSTGGEGVIVKPVKGKYRDDCRGWEYSKIKKFLTREVIVIGFTEPTKEYKGKFPSPDKWQYWEKDGVLYNTSNSEDFQKVSKNAKEFIPVSKYYFENWVGNIRFGVIVSDEDIEGLSKSKKFNIETMTLEGKTCKVLEVGECSGYDEEIREMFSFKYKDRSKWVGSVIEIKANEIFNDTGKLRHPRFLRLREDKSPLECKWKDHLKQNIV